MRVLLVLLFLGLSVVNGCDDPLIASAALSASSQLDAEHAAANAAPSTASAWCAQTNFTDQEYLQIKLPSTKLLKLITVSGEVISVPGPNNTVTNITRQVNSFMLSISEKGSNWIPLKEVSESPAPLQITAQYIRLVPLTYTHHPCLKVQLRGCEAAPAETCKENNGGCSDICKDHAKYCVGSTCFFKCYTDFMCTRWTTCACPAGYELLADKKTCVDINECKRNNGGCNHECENSMGGYQCTCRPGYELREGSQHFCVDTNECKTNNGGCNQDCINTHGSYYCKCDIGYKMSADNHTCEDIDECQKENGGCSHSCLNIKGSYICQCPVGYQLNADLRTCEDVNECQLANGGCEMFCHNNEGSYECSCKDGYKLKDNKLHCEDVDECSGENKCDVESTTCYNYYGGYYCNCKPGYKSSSTDPYKCLEIKCPALVQAVGTTVTPQRCLQPNEMRISETCKFFCDTGYELPDPSKDTLTCQNTGYWDLAIITCRARRCPALTVPANGMVSPSTCSVTGNSYPNRCFFSCNAGYSLTGSSQASCSADGEWSAFQQPTCVKNSPKPWISCPANIIMDLRKGQSTADVTPLWREPKSNVKDIRIEPAQYQTSKVFPYKVTTVKFIASNEQGATDECQIQVTIRDKELPVVTGCPANVYVKTAYNRVDVNWTPPQFTDNVGIKHLSSSSKPGDSFTLGEHNIRYEARDDAGNYAECNFRVYVSKKECPSPDGPEGGSFLCSQFGNVKWCQIQCNPSKKPFISSQGTSCSPDTMKWQPYYDCVDYQPKPASGACPSGTVPQKSTSPWFPAENICVNCQKGMYYDSSDSSCKACPLNHFSSSEAAPQCTPCASGFGTMKTGQKSCKRTCDAGYSSPSGFNLPDEPCYPCPVGYYQDAGRATSCTKCPAGLSTRGVGCSSLDQCGAIPSVLSFDPSGTTEKQEGDSVTLTCVGQGTPEPDVQIYKVLPVPDGFGGPVTKQKLPGKPGLTYTISSLTEHDSGTYMCEVKSSFGQDLQHLVINVIPSSSSGSGALF